MYPTIEGYPSIWILWGLAIVGGMVGSVAMARRDGFPFGVSLGLILLIAFTFLLGAKIHWWIMHSEALAGSDLAGALVRGFHFPGGLVLTALIVPIVFRLCGVSPLRFFDAIAPVAGLAIAVARLGCFLSGCCFGRVCSLPWGLRFPPGSRAYQYHLITYQLPKDQLATLPLHPTQLYFMLAGLGMAGVLFWMRTRKRFDGELALCFAAMWGWSEVVVEAFRDHSVLGGAPYLWFTGIAVALASTVALAVVAMAGAASRSAGS